MISKELIKKIRHIEIKSNRLVDEIFSGEYHSSFKGKGMEFEDIREYYQGDDIRNIDWKVTARHNQVYVKQYCEERELNMFLLIDVSNSNNFGNKKDFIAELGATLSYSANKNNDKVGMILFTDKIEKVVPSKSGKRHVLSIIENILSYQPTNKGTDIKGVLDFFNRIEKKRSVIFVISDFMDDNYEKELNLLWQKHDVVLIHVVDPAEENIPKGAIYYFQDSETDETVVVNALKEDPIKVKEHKAGNVLKLYTNEDYVKKLKLFFYRRRSRWE